MKKDSSEERKSLLDKISKLEMQHANMKVKT